MEFKKFKLKHIPDILAWVQDEAQMVQWAGPGFTWPLTNKQFREYLKAADSESPTLYPFGLYRGSKIIGYCELSNHNRNCDLAIVSRVIISPKFRNKGFAQFMVTKLLEFGFTRLDLNRISLGVFDFNKPAIECYKKLGFSLEGTLRESAKVKDEYWNCHLMSILKKEWLTTQKGESRMAPSLKKPMLIVGGQQVIASENHLENLTRFYRNLFSRMTTEVKNITDLPRYIGYQSIGNQHESLCFLGIEVDHIEDIPQGMVAWDLNENTWTVWQTNKGRNVLVSQKSIAWPWIGNLSSANGRCTGEFTVSTPSESSAEQNSQYHDFWISANAYAGLTEKNSSSDEVHLVDYDPSWPQQFSEIANWLREHLPSEIVLRIEHYGSTATPGMPAKPIIDILIEVPSFPEAKRHLIPLLNSQIWEYWWYLDHMMFIKRKNLMGSRICHIHIAPRGHRLWEGLIFRDYLITHKEDALRYAILKQELAVNYREDRERYTEAKSAFVKEITSKALDCQR